MKKLLKIKIIIGVLLLVGVGFVLAHKSASTTDQEVTPDRAVHTASVAELSLNSSPIPLLGTVVSKNEADIRAETGGRLDAVYKKLGDHVTAGEIIAEFENSAERAGLTQAQGAYDAAKAGVGSAALSSNTAEINTSSANLSLDSAKTAALNVINSAYISLDDAVRVKSDASFRNPQSSNPQFTLTLSDSGLAINIPQERATIENILKTRMTKNQTLSTNDDLVVELTAIEGNATVVKNYLDDLSLAFSRAIPDAAASQTTIDGWKASTGLARTEVGGTLAAIASARSALNASIAASKVAANNLTQTNEGSSDAANAAVKTALGALQAAQSRLTKTIVRSPINGTINSLGVSSGDYVSPSADIAIVSNNGALEIVAYATEDDAVALKVGGKTMINDSVSGVITRIASALDPKTKKIEVRIGITGSTNQLINGQTVRINAVRALAGTGVKNKNIQIPLAALKITPTGSIVFTVDASSSTLIGHPVKEGTLMGDQISILEGLTPDMVIVTDARGLKDGSKVTVAAN